MGRCIPLMSPLGKEPMLIAKLTLPKKALEHGGYRLTPTRFSVVNKALKPNSDANLDLEGSGNTMRNTIF